MAETTISGKTIVFVAPPTGTYTPTNSGALATNIHECALQAQSEGFSPVIMARQAPPGIEPYRDLPAHFVEFPAEPSGLQQKLGRLERKITGWRHVGQRVYLQRLAKVIREKGLQSAPFFISNDPDCAVFLRRTFPGIFIVHRFHNQMESKGRVRSEYPRAANMTVGVSDFTRNWVADYYALPADNARTVYNGVNLEQFFPAASEPAGPPLLNFVGRTGREKAPDTFLEAALILSQQRRDFGVQLVGSNHWGAATMDNFQQRLKELKGQIEGNGVTVTQTGHLSRFEIADAFRRAHIHVVPSRWDEPFGLTTVEGMACGLATIASRTGGSPEIIADAGQLFERENAGELAEKIAPWLDDVELRRQYGRRARERAEFFSWQRTWSGLRSSANL